MAGVAIGGAVLNVVGGIFGAGKAKKLKEQLEEKDKRHKEK